ILGILKAGGAWLPVDPLHASDRQELVLKDARPQFLLTQKSGAPQIPQGDATAIFLDSEWAAIAQCSESNPEINASSLNVAYVMYTSGSTGQPKGVVTTHSNLCHYVR